jgi:glycosyltransferase involved in cell wall biosynthesis
MRIAFVNSTHRWGGVKTWTMAVSRGLTARGHDIHLFLRNGDPFAVACREAGLSVEEMTFGPDWNPWAGSRLKRGLRRQGSQVVLTNVSKDLRIGGPAARSLGLPVLQRVGRRGDITNRFRVRWEQKRYVTRIVVPARAIQESLRAFGWMETEKRVTVIHNGVDLERFRPGSGTGLLRRELGIGDSVPLVVTTGQLTAVKGHAYLLRALARLKAPEEEAPCLVLIGRGREEDSLREQAGALGISNRVSFIGFRSDLHLLLEDADVVVQPSLIEGFPNSVIEFMAKAKAVVASNVDGVNEAVTDGVDGLLVSPGDVDALTATLDGLIRERALRERLGRAARARAETEFGLETMVNRVETLLEELVLEDPAREAPPRPGGIVAT